MACTDPREIIDRSGMTTAQVTVVVITVIGVGRGGAVLPPIVAGYLLRGGTGLPSVVMIMSVGSLLAAFVLLFLKPGQK